VRRHWAVILGIVVTAPQANLHDLLETDAMGFQLLSDDVLVHAASQIVYKKAGAAVLWE
jgi:hypothetical protein